MAMMPRAVNATSVVPVIEISPPTPSCEVTAPPVTGSEVHEG